MSDDKASPVDFESKFLGEGDGDLRHAIRLLAQILAPVASKLRAAVEIKEGPMKPIYPHLRDQGHSFPLAGTSSLIERLRSDADISRADRDLLADVLEGELGRDQGDHRLGADEKQRRRDASSRYHKRMAERPRPRSEAVIVAVAQEFGLNDSTMRKIIKDGAPALDPLLGGPVELPRSKGPLKPPS